MITFTGFFSLPRLKRQPLYRFWFSFNINRHKMVNGILAEVGQIEVDNHAFHTLIFLVNKDLEK